MKKAMHIMVALLTWAAATLSAHAADYTTFLTTERGFTEVTSIDDMIDDGGYYYIIVPAETPNLIVGIGRYEDKPDWAGDNTKALRLRSAATDPVAEMSNFFTIEKDGDYIGFRNVVENSDLFQTHDNNGYMYVLTYSDPTLDEWSYLTPTYQDDYWLFENGKYPMTCEAQWKGYMGSWTPGRLEVGEPIALNRTNVGDDVAGHYRLFRIAKNDLIALKRTPLYSATPSNPVDATWFIVNPSFETGDETGWILQNRNNGDNEFRTREYGMTNKDGDYLMNVYTWWNDHTVSQVVSNIPSGEYELSAVLCTFSDRTATLTGQTSVTSQTATVNGINDQTGIPASVNVTVGNDQKLTIVAHSTTDWWSSKERDTDYYKILFYKVDDIRLTCKSVFLNGYALPLPNNEVTILKPNQWYYYDVTLGAEYVLIGALDGMVYSTDGDKTIDNVNASTPSRKMELAAGRIYFKTTRSDATLYITPSCTVNEGTFSAVALNVDGLPNKILFYNLNEDGPGESGTKKISQYLASKGYDFIGCSEDFNYNGSLMESLKAEYSCGSIRKTLSVGGLSGGLPFDTDGLNLLWKNSKISATNESWTRWTSTTSTDGNQYVKKGYRHYDVLIDGSALIDVFILHMDAGDASDSRHAQWEQLAGAINSADATRPKLIIGDTNSRWTREEIAAHFMNRLNANLAASDVWVEKCRNNVYPTTAMGDLTDQSDPSNFSNYEIVDKIIYINPTAPNTLQLVPQSFKIENDYTYDYVDHDGNTKPLGDHRPVVVEFKWIKSGDAVNMPITLTDNGDNTTTIRNTSGIVADVTIQDRTLYKDNSWNTLCLPFNMTADQVTTQLAPSELKELDTADNYEHVTGLDGSTLYLNFKDAQTIEVGKPYLIKWSNGGSNIVNPQFTGVTVSDSEAMGIASTDGTVTFQGTYAPVALAKDDKTNLYLDEEDTLNWPIIDNFYVNAFRAYFHLSPNSGARKFVLNFGDNVSTGIRSLTPTPNDEGSIYSLTGVKLQGEPKKNGLFIQSGKKRIITGK